MKRKSKSDELFYSESNMRELDASIKQLERGQVVRKTLEELERMSKDENSQFKTN